ncbi:hypothetical protein [Nocardia sp. NPDC005998]|uniref:hypothetical protein n=1 Tax=Nocardia sp. NPDC005998 TaxID=3156894 RepID=UPI0033BC7F65
MNQYGFGSAFDLPRTAKSTTKVTARELTFTSLPTQGFSAETFRVPQPGEKLVTADSAPGINENCCTATTFAYCVAEADHTPGADT